MCGGAAAQQATAQLARAARSKESAQASGTALNVAWALSAVDAAQAARASYDVTAVVLNNDFVLNAGFKPAEALVRENPTTAKSYVNVIVVRQVDKDKKIFQTLKAIMNSDEIKKKTEELFPGAVPAW
jgi:ABC-type metal ion transport system substrate-binding protein